MKIDITVLTDIGLTADQAEIYLCLLEKGSQKAVSVSKHIGIKREMTYKCLNQLFELGIVDKTKPSNSVTEFQARHPDSLKVLVERKQRASQFAEISFTEAHGYLSSLYNLSIGKPNVQFYEGEKGLKLAFDDLLSAKEEVYAYVDYSTVHQYLKEANDWYVIERRKKGSHKKILAPDTEIARQMITSDSSFTEVRFIKHLNQNINASIQIYDGKVLYVTIIPSGPLVVIISDPMLYQMQRVIFESIFKESLKIG